MPRVFVGIGSNIDRETSVRAGVVDLRGKYGELQLSSVYESEAVGFEGDAFYNLVAAFDTSDSVDQVIKTLAEIEETHGRQRGSERFSSRTLDLDLLLYGDLVASGEGYHVPRDEIPRYAFVLWPLSELEPAMKHPQTGETFLAMWEDFDKRNQPLLPIHFQW
ncbi:MAG: 2-amino-4-hydroxy-6-hydroxymethyldihydropteridine diphosphokinase [Gammaproteobacteria bacterium]|nr:2-amino-4-hydroxy-6-hydroxymethyldihydropteridine diphosphokinase [Gammaproteobacteria bacterium]